jgi:hypothetical protein
MKRLVDINGKIIVEPCGYYETLELSRSMIDSMEEENIDRSDMCLVIDSLHREMQFCLSMLKNRDK